MPPALAGIQSNRVLMSELVPEPVPDATPKETPAPPERELTVPRASGQPICSVVSEEHGAARVRAFARRWRAYRYHREEKRRPWLATHDLCGAECTGLTSRCLRVMEREGFLCAVHPVRPAA